MREKIDFGKLTVKDSNKTSSKSGVLTDRFMAWLLTNQQPMGQVWAKNLACYVNVMLRDEGMPNLTAERAQDIAAHILVSDYSKSAKRSHLIALEYWMEYIGRPVHFTKPRATKRNLRYLTEEEMSCLIRSALNYRDAAILEVFCTTGMRLGELVALNIGDIDFPNGVIRIRHGKGDKEREVFLTDECRQFLAAYMERWILERERGDNKPLFVSRNGRISPQAVAAVVRTTAQRAGLPPTTPHVLRHSYATCYASKNKDVFTLQDLMGHSTIDQTKRYYHGNREMKREGAMRGAPSLL